MKVVKGCGGRFSKVPATSQARKAVFFIFYLKMRVRKDFINSALKISVKETMGF